MRTGPCFDHAWWHLRAHTSTYSALGTGIFPRPHRAPCYLCQSEVCLTRTNFPPWSHVVGTWMWVSLHMLCPPSGPALQPHLCPVCFLKLTCCAVHGALLLCLAHLHGSEWSALANSEPLFQHVHRQLSGVHTAHDRPPGGQEDWPLGRVGVRSLHCWSSVLLWTPLQMPHVAMVLQRLPLS